MEAHDLDDGASSSRFEAAERSTTDGADIVADTNDGVLTTDRAFSWISNLPAC